MRGTVIAYISKYLPQIKYGESPSQPAFYQGGNKKPTVSGITLGKIFYTF
jgi:hypothetical protein